LVSITSFSCPFVSIYYLGNKKKKSSRFYCPNNRLFTDLCFAAAEQWNASPRQMTIADMGMRTRNGIGVEMLKLLTA
jgi:hypothetical protein